MPFQRQYLKESYFAVDLRRSEQKKPFIFKRLMKLENYLLWLSYLEPGKKPVREGMMKCLKIGSQGEEEMVVGRDDLASVMGNIGAEVLSTHRVVLLMEMAARNAIKDCLPEGKMTVGNFIRIQHLAAAPLGSKIRAEAWLKEIEGRKLFFDVAAYDEFEKIAEGENEQLIVSINNFLARVHKKTVR